MSHEFDRLVEIVRKLRAPNGCPWDREQTHRSLVPCLLDEAYECLEAIDEYDDAMMNEEFGDLLLQVVLHAVIAEEESRYTVDSVVKGIADKLIHRHPHVFGETIVTTSAEVLINWEIIKKGEKSERKSALDGISASLPALFRAEKVQKRAARVGFDWPDVSPVLDKVEEEFGEFRDALKNNESPDRIASELGDIIFSLINVARHHGISAEDAVRMTTKKFETRFRYVEEQIEATGRKMTDSTLEEMDIYWEKSKKIVG